MFTALWRPLPGPPFASNVFSILSRPFVAFIFLSFYLYALYLLRAMYRVKSERCTCLSFFRSFVAPINQTRPGGMWRRLSPILLLIGLVDLTMDFTYLHLGISLVEIWKQSIKTQVILGVMMFSLVPKIVIKYSFLKSLALRYWIIIVCASQITRC